MAKTVNVKPEVVTPKKSTKKVKNEQPKNKRSVIVHKKQERIDNLYQLLGEVERTIEELTRIYAELPDSKHRGVGGRIKHTTKQETIAEQIRQAQKRADRLMKLIERMD